jgi:hypothetical protein
MTKRARRFFVLTFLLLWHPGIWSFAEKLASLPQLTRPGMIEVIGDEFYVVQDVEVYIYSLKDFSLLRKFGQKGEGPGEFSPTDFGLHLQPLKDKLFLNTSFKMINFSKTGELVKEQTFPYLVFQVVPLGKNYVIVKLTSDQIMVKLMEPGLKEIKTLYERPGDIKPGERPVPPSFIYIRSSEEKLFVCDQKSGFHIMLFDSQGNPLPSIKIDYEPLKVTASFKKEFMEWIVSFVKFKSLPPQVQEQVKSQLKFQDYLPVIRNFLVKDGKIYVQTYKEKDKLSEFVIIDFKGKVLKKVFLPGATQNKVEVKAFTTYTISGGMYYYLLENEDTEEWEVHRLKI